MGDKSYFRETSGAVASAINVVKVEGKAADWIQAVAGGAISWEDGSGTTTGPANANAGEVYPGPILSILSSAGKIRYGTGEMPRFPSSSGADATNAAASATAAAGSATTATTQATNAATSATTATTQATNAATSATAAAASAASAAAALLTPSTTVITADPAPAVVGTLYDCDPTSASFPLTLPAISSGNHGKRIGINVVTMSSNHVTPTPNGTDTVPVSFATVSGAYGFVILEADNGVSPKAWRRAG